MKIFNFDDYRDFIKAQIKSNQKTLGYQTKLARAAGCHPSFLSQVLHSHVQLTPDHAVRFALFWNLESDERDYFLEMVALERASSRELKDVVLEKINILRKKNKELENFSKQQKIPDHQRAVYYYSSWLYPALHIALSVPNLQDKASLMKRFQLSVEELKRAITVLTDLGLVEQFKPDRWRPTEKLIHAPRRSPFSRNNHMNWRNRAVSQMQKGIDENLHYTSVYALSKSDAKQLEEIVRQCIDTTRRLVEPSKEEDVYCFCCDLFRI